MEMLALRSPDLFLFLLRSTMRLDSLSLLPSSAFGPLAALALTRFLISPTRPLFPSGRMEYWKPLLYGTLTLLLPAPLVFLDPLLMICARSSSVLPRAAAGRGSALAAGTAAAAEWNRRAFCACLRSAMFPLLRNMGLLQASIMPWHFFLMSGTSWGCFQRSMTTFPKPEFFRSDEDIPGSSVVLALGSLEMASRTSLRSVTFPSFLFGRGWTHRLHCSRSSALSSGRSISSRVRTSRTSPSILSLLVAGLRSLMQVSSSSAASFIRFTNCAASSSSSLTFFFSFFFFCMRLTTALSAAEALAPSPPSSSLRLILSTPAPPDFLPRPLLAFAFAAPSSSLSMSSTSLSFWSA
mmetsp:Transcript_31753/g.75776  ORF Transcript_31753/g.75776 Transcript_31753/m.75776 type:complete len:352 (-) Transcript_31753:651-1706(-)